MAAKNANIVLFYEYSSMVYADFSKNTKNRLTFLRICLQSSQQRKNGGNVHENKKFIGYDRSRMRFCFK